MAQGAASPAPPPTPPAGSLGPHSPRSGSSFFDRFGRRPRTANSSSTSNIRTTSTSAGGAAVPPFNANSNASIAGNNAAGTQQQQPALPRSSSSSNINNQLLNFPRDAHTSPPATPPAVNVHRNPLGSGAAAAAGASPQNNGSGSAIGRMFRRYSHGAGKNSSQDAASGRGNAGPSSGTAAAAAAGGSPSPAVPPSPSSRPSALRSLSNHFITSSSSLAARVSPADALTRTMSNQISAMSGGLASNAVSRSSIDGYTAATGGRLGGANTSGAATGESGQTTSQASGASGQADTSSGAHASNQDAQAAGSSSNAVAGPSTATAAPGNASQGYRIRLVPHLEAARSLHFEPIERELRDGAPAIKIGRFTERGAASAGTGAGASGSANANASSSSAAAGSAFGTPSREGLGTAVGTGAGLGALTLGSNARGTGGEAGFNAESSAAGPSAGGVEGVPSTLTTGGRRQVPDRSRSGVNANNKLDLSRIAFKSKVVSRGHAEIWCENGGTFFLRDTKSSSGTFLNHIRLSAPGVESRPHRIKDGDVVQLGVDYQGGTEEIYRCVKMRVELNRGWQREANQYNINALRQLRALQGSPMPGTPTGDGNEKAIALGGAASGTVSAVPQPPTSVTDCCICLFSVTVCQALFIAPCSHVFHYKCIRPLITQHHPGFSCPLCRTFADLEADVEQEEEWQADLIRQATQGPEVVGAATPSATPAPIASAAPEPMSAQPTLASGLAAPAGAASVASPLATVLETHSRPGSEAPSQDRPNRGSGSEMAVDQNESSQGPQQNEDEDQQEVLQDDEDELMEEFDGPSSSSAGGRYSSTDDEVNNDSSQAPSQSQAEFVNNSNLSLSASGSLAARRSLNNAVLSPAGAASTGTGGGVSEPITMPISANAPLPGNGLEDARTPMNQHFLSTLAESTPGGPAFFSAVAARAAAAAAAAGGAGLTNGHSPAAQQAAADVDIATDRSPPGIGGGQTPTGPGVKREALGNGEVAASGAGSSGEEANASARDAVMSD